MPSTISRKTGGHRARLGLLVLCLAACLALLGSTKALAAGPYVSSGSFGGEGSAAGLLKEPAGVAVNEAQGYVYVVDKGNDRVERFGTTGAYELQFTGEGTLANENGKKAPAALSAPEWIAVDNSTDPADPSAGDVYVADTALHVIDKFSAAGAYIGQLTEVAGSRFGGFYGVAVDPAGALWVFEQTGGIYNFSDSEANEYLASRTSPYGEGNPSGFAVDSEDNLYVQRGYEYFAKLNSTGEGLNEEFGAAGGGPNASAAAVDFSNNDVYLDNIDSVGLVSPQGALLERFGEGSLSQGTGIAVEPLASGAFPEGSVYVADATSDSVQIYAHEQPTEPAVIEESVANVTADSATLEGELNPEGADTTYYFRYGTASCASSPGACTDVPLAPGANAGAGFGAVTAIPVDIQGLTPSAVYHFQIVATNAHGTVAGVEHTFTTQAIGGAFVLPDNRGYEMVSPLEKNGGDVLGIDAASGGGVTQAAADGEAFTFLMFTSLPGAKGNPFADEYIAHRAANGWSTESLDSPTNAESYDLGSDGATFKQYSNDLELGIMPDLTVRFQTGLGTEAPQLSPEAPAHYPNIYIRNTATGEMTPIMTYTNSERTEAPTAFDLGFDLATPDLDHVLFSAGPLLPGAITSTGNNLYEWTDGKIELVSILPDGTPTSEATLETRGDGTAPSPTSISADGRVVIFKANGDLYARVGIGTPQAATVQVDSAQGGSESGGGQFELASTDGSDIYFTDLRALTAGAWNASGSSHERTNGNLYRYDVDTGALTDLTVGANVPDVLGVVGASGDGSYVYFAANGRLAEGASLGDCHAEESKSPAGATCNLYVAHDGGVRLVSELSGEDEVGVGDSLRSLGLHSGAWQTDLVARSVRVSADGRSLLYMSHLPLTGYGNRGSRCLPVETGEWHDLYNSGRCAEVYLYSFETGRVRCVSCNPTGASPQGPSGIPPGTAVNTNESLYQSRVLASDGNRVFFDSADALVPQDTNGKIDVYEWEADGEGSCTQSEGCIFLISGGKSSEDVGFVDASENGDDVFFTTRAQLVPSDVDGLVDVYDARVGGGVPPVNASPTCTGTGCQGQPAQAPVFATPPSVTFKGLGNFPPLSLPSAVKAPPPTRAQKLAKALRACEKRAKKRRAACERVARRRYRAKGSFTTKKPKGRGR